MKSLSGWIASSMMAVSIVTTSAAAQTVGEPRVGSDGRVSNWRTEAQTNLETRQAGSPGRDLSPGQLNARVLGKCAFINNYWCTKQLREDGKSIQETKWDDSIPPYGDDKDHAIFKNAEAGARAAVRNLRTKYFREKDPRRTLRGLYCEQAPKSGCVGDVVGPDGKTCLLGTNPCDKNAAKMASELGVSADKPLALFVGTNPDRARVNRVFVMGYLRRLSRDELSVNGAPRVWAREAIIDRGIQREYNDKLKGLLKARRPAAAGT